MSKPKFVFFGTPEFAVSILNELESAGFSPSLVITGEDKPVGRKLVMTPPPVKVWAEKRNIPVLQPRKLSDPDFISKLKTQNFKLFIVASYGKIIPKSVLDIPTKGTLNVHPSLLPKLRGPSPILGAILNEDKTGVTIMLIDEEMDHGPIVSQKEVSIYWPPYESDLEKLLAKEGGKLLASTIPLWLGGEISSVEQDHSKATYTKKVEKEDAHIDLSDDSMTNLRKIRAYEDWPGAFTFIDTKQKEKMRIVITKADIREGILFIEKVIPEGKKEMTWEDFERGYIK